VGYIAEVVDTGAVFENVLAHYFILKKLTNAYIYYSGHFISTVFLQHDNIPNSTITHQQDQQL